MAALQELESFISKRVPFKKYMAKGVSTDRTVQSGVKGIEMPFDSGNISAVYNKKREYTRNEIKNQ